MKRLLILACLLATPAIAQQQPDPAMLQRAIGAVQAQRNQALDQAASCSASAGSLADELTKAQARIKTLEQPPEPPKE